MKLKKITAIFTALALIAAVAGCNKQGKGTLGKVRAKTNKVFKEVDKAARGTIKKVKGK